MSPQHLVHAVLRYVCLVTTIALAGALGVHAQEAPPPAYLASVDGEATLERDGAAEPATRNMPFVPGDRLRTGAGRVEILFPDGSGIEVGEYSEVEAVSATRVRLLAGTMDHIQRQAAAASRSASYLPSDLRPYGNTFDQYGSWQNDPAYGYVWYPAVEPDWRPYYYGSWSPIRSYGWTWIGLDAWAWPTHHYGRWGYARNAWFWIPGRTWGAAWVSWSFADDYVSWCPLGYDSRPVFALSFGSRRAWDHWTVPRRSFGARGSYVGRYANDYRAGRRESIGGRRESIVGSRGGRPTPNDSGARRYTNNDLRTTTADARPRPDYRRPSQATPTLPGANGGAVAMSRAGTSYSVGSRDSGVGSRDSGVGIRNRQRNDVAVPRATAPERVYMPPASYRGREQSAPRSYSPGSQTSLPAATGGAMPRVGTRDSGFGARASAVESRDRRPTTDYRPPPTEYRQPAGGGYRQPSGEARPRHEAPAASGGASAPRSMPHERAAAPSAGDARPRGQERPAQGQGRRR